MSSETNKQTDKQTPQQTNETNKQTNNNQSLIVLLGWPWSYPQNCVLSPGNIESAQPTLSMAKAYRCTTHVHDNLLYCLCYSNKNYMGRSGKFNPLQWHLSYMIFGVHIRRIKHNLKPYLKLWWREPQRNKTHNWNLALALYPHNC